MQMSSSTPVLRHQRETVVCSWWGLDGKLNVTRWIGVAWCSVVRGAATGGCIYESYEVFISTPPQPTRHKPHDCSCERLVLPFTSGCALDAFYWSEWPSTIRQLTAFRRVPLTLHSLATLALAAADFASQMHRPIMLDTNTPWAKKVCTNVCVCVCVCVCV